MYYLANFKRKYEKYLFKKKEKDEIRLKDNLGRYSFKDFIEGKKQEDYDKNISNITVKTLKKIINRSRENTSVPKSRYFDPYFSSFPNKSKYQVYQELKEEYYKKGTTHLKDPLNFRFWDMHFDHNRGERNTLKTMTGGLDKDSPIETYIRKPKQKERKRRYEVKVKYQQEEPRKLRIKKTNLFNIKFPKKERKFKGVTKIIKNEKNYHKNIVIKNKEPKRRKLNKRTIKTLRGKTLIGLGVGATIYGLNKLRKRRSDKGKTRGRYKN